MLSMQTLPFVPVALPDLTGKKHCTQDRGY
jgi:hypothetical protein